MTKTPQKLSRRRPPVKTLPSRELLQSVLAYDPDSGDLTWKLRSINFFTSRPAWKTWNSRYGGKPAGSTTEQYASIDLSHVGAAGRFRVHRVIFALMDTPEAASKCYQMRAETLFGAFAKV